MPTACVEKLRELGEKLTAGAVPVPERLIGGVLGALSVIVIEPLREPVAVGENVTLMAQEAPAATLDPQLLVSEKSPLEATLVIVSAAPPVFVSVTL